jgi:large subunit ribosomal protein L32
MYHICRGLAKKDPFLYSLLRSHLHITLTFLIVEDMPVPPKRLSKGRTRRRRAHHALTVPMLTTCPQCKKPTKPHMACPSCGYYRGRDVLGMQKTVERKMQKRMKRVAAQAPAAEEKAEKKEEKKSDKK